MHTGRIAIPSISGGGLKGQKSPHFEYCDTFTLVDVDNCNVRKVFCIQNQKHMEEDIRTPVEVLAAYRVDALIVGGIGMEAFKGIKQAGIEVYYEWITADIASVVCDLIFDKLPLYTNRNVWEWPFSRKVAKGKEIASFSISNGVGIGDICRNKSFSTSQLGMVNGL